MLLKRANAVFIPAVQAVPARGYSRTCPSKPADGSGTPSGSSAAPHGCYTLFTYGPPSPIDGQPTILSYRTVCYG